MKSCRRFEIRPSIKRHVLVAAGLLFFAFRARAVTVEVTGLRNDRGQIVVDAYTQAAGFPDTAPSVAHFLIEALNGGTARGTIDLPAGTYAFTVFHDENSDREINRGHFGIPLEGFGFSNSPRVYLHAPNFNKCAVKIEDPLQVISIKIQYMGGR